MEMGGIGIEGMIGKRGMRGIWSVRLLRGLEISCALCRLGKNRSGGEGKGGVICHDTGSFFFYSFFFLFTLEFDVVAIVVCLVLSCFVLAGLLLATATTTTAG